MNKNIIKLANKIYKNTPAFREFLQENGNIKISKNLEKLPYMTKENYIKKYDLNKRVILGKISNSYFLYSSSGTSGKATIWPEIREEQSKMKGFVKIMKQVFDLKKNKTLLIVGFSLGSWIGGEYVAWLSRNIALNDKNLTVITPGNNYDEIIQIVQKISPEFQQNIIAAVPSSITRIIHLLIEKGIDIKKYNLKFICFGEGFSDSWRVWLNNICGNGEERVFNIYGAADVGMLSLESKLTHKFLGKFRRDKKLLKKYFGSEKIPTFGITKIDENNIIENSENGLIISKFQGVPLFRYNIGDKGGIIPLKDFKADFKIPYFDFLIKNYYILYVFGRNDDMLLFNGSNFPKSILEKALDFNEIFPINKQIGIGEDKNHKQQFIIYLDEKFKKKLEKKQDFIKEKFINNLRKLQTEFDDDYKSIFSKLENPLDIIEIKFINFEGKNKINFIKKN